MSEMLRDQVLLHGPPTAVWAIIDDPAALERVLPGAEAIVRTGPDTFRGVLGTRIQFLTVRADIEATFLEPDPPRHLVLRLDGRPRGLAGSFSVIIPFDLSPTSYVAAGRDPEAGTQVSYAVDLTVTGRLASFGIPLLRDTLRRVIATLVANVDTELRRSHGETP
jgi:carbon monoxide dehydrogenase subunit G